MVEVPHHLQPIRPPENISHLSRYLLMVDPIIGMKWLTNVLMDGGSGLNILYAETLDAMGIDQACMKAG
jgi:Na+/glutamate symporter